MNTNEMKNLVKFKYPLCDEIQVEWSEYDQETNFSAWWYSDVPIGGTLEDRTIVRYVAYIQGVSFDSNLPWGATNLPGSSPLLSGDVDISEPNLQRDMHLLSSDVDFSPPKLDRSGELVSRRTRR